MRGRARTTACVLAGTLALAASPAWAYRPFVSTDAAVADPGFMEIELGYFQLAHEHHEDTFSTPKLVLNYGIVDRLEIVGEFAAEKAPHDDWRLVDPAPCVQVVREGLELPTHYSGGLEADPARAGGGGGQERAGL